MKAGNWDEKRRYFTNSVPGRRETEEFGKTEANCPNAFMASYSCVQLAGKDVCALDTAATLIKHSLLTKGSI